MHLPGSHRLWVETGRWERPVIPYESRICTMCHKLDNEFHFLLECPRYHDIIRQYLPTYFTVRHCMFKCIELLNTNNDKTILSLAKYVLEAFRVRSLSVSWYVHVLCVMHWLRRGAVAVAIAGRWLHPWMSLRHSRLQTVTACGRRDHRPHSRQVTGARCTEVAAHQSWAEYSSRPTTDSRAAMGALTSMLD